LVGPLAPPIRRIDQPARESCDVVTRQYPSDMITVDSEAQQILKFHLQFVREHNLVQSFHHRQFLFSSFLSVKGLMALWRSIF
jgi:hypothetical protein